MSSVTSMFPGLFRTSPFMPSVTAGTVLESGAPGPQVNFATPGNPNVNYATLEAAQALASLYGGQVNAQNMGQDYGPAGPPSAPIYSISFPGQKNSLGYEVDIPAGQIAQWLLRGDTDYQIQQRLGLIPSQPMYGPNRPEPGPGPSTQAPPVSAGSVPPDTQFRARPPVTAPSVGYPTTTQRGSGAVVGNPRQAQSLFAALLAPRLAPTSAPIQTIGQYLTRRR